MRLTAITPVVLFCGTVANSAIAQVATTQPSDSRNPQVVYVVPEGRAFHETSPYLPPPPRPIAPESIAQQYSVVIRLDSSADIAPLSYNSLSSADSQTAATLLTSTALIDPAASRALGLSQQQRRDAVVVNVYPSGGRIARLEVTLLKGHGDYAADAAHKLASALLESLKNAYDQSSQAARKAVATRRASVEKELKETKDRADALHAKIRELRSINSGVYRGPDAQSVLEGLHTQKRNTEAEITRSKSRLGAIDPMSRSLADELADVVKLREKQVEEITKRQQAGSATQADVDDAKAKVIEARGALAQARQSSSSRIDRSGEVASLRSSLADAEERLKQTNAQIAKLEDPKLGAEFDQLPDMQNEEQRLKNRLTELDRRVEQIQASDADVEVIITVLDGLQSKD